MDRLTIKRVGPIADADIRFGDLTVFVGPQATGKSVALQFVKLLEDTVPIRNRLREYAVEWNGVLDRPFETFFGEGTRSLWSDAADGSKLAVDGVEIEDLLSRLNRGGISKTKPSVFYIPAQRALTIREGWPRPFSDYGATDPYTVRDFSDELRILLDGINDSRIPILPKSDVSQAHIRSILSDTVFHGFNLTIDRSRPGKRMMLSSGSDDGTRTLLPFMEWSAGQREFVPMLLGLYWLMPDSKRQTHRVDLVVIEEPEMGLHPRATCATMLLVLELLSRGFRVCLSTHSSDVLDIVWALRVLREHGGTPEDVLDLFALPRDQHELVSTAANSMIKQMRVYYFQTSGVVLDISGLDPGSAITAESGWGGLAEFSGRVSDVVARVIARDESGD